LIGHHDGFRVNEGDCRECLSEERFVQPSSREIVNAGTVVTRYQIFLWPSLPCELLYLRSTCRRMFVPFFSGPAMIRKSLKTLPFRQRSSVTKIGLERFRMSSRLVPLFHCSKVSCSNRSASRSSETGTLAGPHPIDNATSETRVANVLSQDRC